MLFRLLITLWLFIATASSAETDPYQWLEAVDDEKSLDWVRAQNKQTESRLKSDPLFQQLYQQALTVLNADTRIPQVNQQGKWLYNFWRDAAHPRGIYRRTTLQAYREQSVQWDTVLDIDALAKNEGENWVFKGMNCLQPEYIRCLTFLSPGGGDAVEIREFNMQRKSFTTDGFKLPVAKQQAGWIDQDHLFVSSEFGPDSMTTSGYSREVRIWKRGHKLEQAKTIFLGAKESVSAGASRLSSKPDTIDIVSESISFWQNNYHLYRNGKTTALQLPDTSSLLGAYQGDLVLLLNQNWERHDQKLTQGSVIIAQIDQLIHDNGRLQTLFAPSPTRVVDAVNVSDSAIFLTLLDQVQSKLIRYQRKQGKWAEQNIPFPDNGHLSVNSVDDKSGDLFVTYEGFITPPSLYHVAGNKSTPSKIKAQAASFNANDFKVEQAFAQSNDGTQVPYFVVNTKLDGSNPTHIFSYGGFRVSLTPSYSGSYEALSGAYGKLWLERGGIFVLANIRGGGEFGPAWHAAALRENRNLAFEDFEAVAEDLIERRITSPDHLGIEGRSNGGLLVGATMTRRPELYAAVICGVPLLDMQRYHLLLAGASWMAEYGNPDVAEDWEFIRQYSPYHQLKTEQKYPSILFYTSTRDDRVHPGHARKMAAKMTAMGYPVEYYENLEGGHGGSSTNDQLAYRLALAYTHLWRELK